MRYNLLDECWIPTDRGMRSLLSVFDEGIQLSGSPMENISILRLVTGIVAATLQLSNDEDAENAIDYLDDTRGKVLSYLKKWHGRFYLYHDTHPFMQVLGLLSEKGVRSIEELDVAATFGANQGIVSMRQSSRINGDASIALGLVTYQNFVFNSKGHVDNNLTLFDSSEDKEAYFDSRKIKIFNKSGTTSLSPFSPCLRTPSGGRGSMHAMVLGDDVLVSALFMAPTINELIPLGKPVWEIECIREDCTELVDTYLGSLIPLTRFITIDGDHFSATTGITHSRSFLPETLLQHKIIPKKGKGSDTIHDPFWDTVMVDGSWSSWRSMPEVLQTLLGDKMVRCPALFRAKERFTGASAKLYIASAIVGASSGETFAVTDELSLTYLMEDINEASDIHVMIQSVVEGVDKLQKSLIRYERDFWKGIYGEPKKVVESSQIFLTSLLPFSRLFSSSFEQQKENLIYMAVCALQKSCPERTPNQIRAFAKIKKSFNREVLKL